MDSVSRRLLVAVAALSLVAVCAVGQDYMVRLNSNMENAIAAECVEKGGAENPVPNPSWYLNGAGIGESMCLNTTGTLDANRLLFTITPDCEGYLQCSAGFRSSLPKRVYAYPTHTAGRPITQVTMPALLGTDVVLTCYLTVSTFRNFEACWFFTSSTVNRIEINNSCTTGSDYSLRLPMVASNNEGMYQCEATATVRSGLQGSPLLSVLAPIIDLEVFEPVQLTGEIIASSLQDDMYQFSAPSVRGTTPYTYKWFINSIENTSTDSTLTIRLSNSLTTVMVSVSNHQDLTNTTFTVNRTAIVNPRPLMCPTISPTNSSVSPLTLDTIVPAALLAVFVVLGFLAIFILLFITFYLYNRKCDLQQDMLNGQAKLERSLEEKEQRINELRSVKEDLQAQNQSLILEKVNLQHQISVGSDITDGFPDNPVALHFAKIAMDIKNHCPGSSTARFYLVVVGNIMNCLSQHCSDKRFRNLVRDVRDNAQKLFDTLVDGEYQSIQSDCGDGGNVCTDDVPDLENAKEMFRMYLGKLDALVEKTEE